MIRYLTLALLVPGVALAREGEAVTYLKELRPVLRKHCVGCHNSDRARGNLDLSSYPGILNGGTSGKVAFPGKPEQSLLYRLAAHLEDPIMPPGKEKIAQKDLDVIKKWIAGGMVEKPGGAPAVVERTKEKGGLVPAKQMPRATAITALAVSPRGLLAVNGLKQALLFDLKSGKLLGALAFPEGEVHALRFSRDGSLLLVAGGVGGMSGKAVAFETKGWKRAFEVGDEPDAVLAADISPDNKIVAIGGPGKAVKAFDAKSGKQLYAYRRPTDWVTALRFSPEGLLLAAGDRFGGLFVVEAKAGKPFAELRGHTKGVHALDWRADSDVLASAAGDGTVRVWDLHKAEEVAKWAAHEGGTLALSYHPTGRIATAGRDGKVKVWKPSGELVSSLGKMSDEVLHVAWAPDGKSVVAGDWAGEARVWKAAGGPSKLALPVRARPPEVAVVLPPEPKVPAVVPTGEWAEAEEQARRAAEELAEARRGLAAAEAAAASLRKIVEARAAAAERAAERLRKLRQGGR